MDVTFARLALAALANVPAVHEFAALHSTSVPTDKSEVFPAHTLSLLVDTGSKTRAELFRRYMQSPSYARKLMFALQQHRPSPQVKTLIDRLLEDGVVVTINAVYSVPAVPPKKKATSVAVSVYRNGIYNPAQYLRDFHMTMDNHMFDLFVTSYLAGEYDGLFD